MFLTKFKINVTNYVKFGTCANIKKCTNLLCESTVKLRKANGREFISRYKRRIIYFFCCSQLLCPWVYSWGLYYVPVKKPISSFAYAKTKSFAKWLLYAYHINLKCGMSKTKCTVVYSILYNFWLRSFYERNITNYLFPWKRKVSKYSFRWNE